MIDRLARSGSAVYLLLAGYFILNVIVRLSLPASLELDEGQQLFLAQWLAIGYDSQPPFYNWLQYGAVHLLGDTVAALSVLKNLMLFGCYLLFGLAAHLMIRNRVLAVIATLGLLTIPQISFEAQRDLTHTVAVLFAACLFIYFFIRAIERPNAINYAMTGVAIGIGVISKYNFILLPVAAVLAILPERDLRKRLFDPRLLLTVMVSVAIAAPHAWWFLHHVGEATSRTVGKLMEDPDDSRPEQIAEGLLSLLAAIAAFTLPTLLFFGVAFGRTLLGAWKADNQWTRLIGRMFLLLVAALVLLVIFGGASNIKDRWLVPFFFLLPIYLCLKIEASGETVDIAPRRFGMIAIAIMIIVPLSLFARIPLLGAMGRYEKQNVPYGPAIEAILASSRQPPSIIATEDQQMAGNLRLHARGIPVMIPGYESFAEPYPFDPAHPVLVVWRNKGKADATMPAPLAAWIAREPPMRGSIVQARDIALAYHYGRAGDAYHFRYAWLYPAGK